MTTAQSDLIPHVQRDELAAWSAAASALANSQAVDVWQWAPVEPTEEMVATGCRHENMGDMTGRYQAMLAVAPRAATSSRKLSLEEINRIVFDCQANNGEWYAHNVRAAIEQALRVSEGAPV
ncbi:hypothetical protein F6X40_35490 [Paraburkholderia sp. UCT31]|uniref:hypothetical protein n=1 Tax=Paraburkholderia sp. UCT31 TaxID=2615209 RepID=UPI0016556D58|nr:hypothetical protein [Paraburkholderia sp. UCT31]MBC8741854.1 hypothetical protein [Paraburkholderia sp. UCT31]